MGAPARLAVGPVNSAGQATAWAHAVAAHTRHEAFSFAHADLPGRRGWAFEADRRLPHHRLVPDVLKPRVARWVLRDATHLAIDSFASLHHRLDRSHVGAELDRLRSDLPGVRLALVAHGSDLRDPQRHAARLAESYYRIAPAEWNEQLGARAARNRAVVRDSGLPLFVSTPDLLLEDVPATWLPVVVDPARFGEAPPPFTGPRVRVLHLPSRRVPPIKGTDVIEPVLRRLHDRGEIEFVSPPRVDPSRVPALVASCDVVVEQVRSGYYSAHAVEGMAAGRLVVSSLADDVASLMSEAPPLVRVPGGAFADVMRAVLDDPAGCRRLAADGPGFVRRWHDGRCSAAVLAPWLDGGTPSEPRPASMP